MQTVINTENITSNDDTGVIYSLNSKQNSEVLSHLKVSPSNNVIQFTALDF